MVVTLLVVPAMGASIAVTEPLLPARPERGSGVACACCAALGWDGPCAKACDGSVHARSAIAAIVRIGVIFIFEWFMARNPSC